MSMEEFGNAGWGKITRPPWPISFGFFAPANLVLQPRSLRYMQPPKDSTPATAMLRKPHDPVAGGDLGVAYVVLLLLV